MDASASETPSDMDPHLLARERADKLARTKAEWLKRRTASSTNDQQNISPRTETQNPPLTNAQHAQPDSTRNMAMQEKLQLLRKQRLANSPTSSTAPEPPGVIPHSSDSSATDGERQAHNATPPPPGEHPTDEIVGTAQPDITPESQKRHRNKPRWTPERKLEAAEKRAADAAVDPSQGSPQAVRNAKRLAESVKVKARKVREEAVRKESHDSSLDNDKLAIQDSEKKLKFRGDKRQPADNPKDDSTDKGSVSTRSRAAAPAKSTGLPEWRTQADINLESRTAGGRNTTAERDAYKDSIPKLQKLNRELTAALARWEGATGERAMRGMGRLQGGEENKWAFIDESDVTDFHERIPEMPMRFPFELDTFQKRAVMHVEQRNSVFVAAHTSAGKTVVAEYAIALAAEFGSKVIYTSPIKTLSNQKLRDFRKKFDDVGLVTGDVSINEDAQCVIMTTEILRSMLYKGADVIRDLMFVVFDEVQFLNDEERGVVWEESIIMLPPHVGIIMLSATVPNALEFASWVGKTKERRIAVVSTMQRPVPLQHSWLHRSSDVADELTEALLLTEGGTFLQANFRAALRANSMAGAADSKKKSSRQKRSRRKKGEEGASGSQSPEDSPTPVAGTKNDEPHDAADVTQGSTSNDLNGEGILGEPGTDGHLVSSVSGVEDRNSEGFAPFEHTRGVEANNKASKGTCKIKSRSLKQVIASVSEGGGTGPNQKHSPWVPLVRFLNRANRTPSVVFCFSKKKCDKAVDSLEHADLLPDASDKAYVHRFFEKSILKLREEDRTIPQVQRVRTNLKRGISSHHAGLLPLIKEITEILFSKGLVKVLFATETFAMGVNMPARTVVFAAVRKHDGRSHRFLEAGEYTQMSGRAGRRGIDTTGHVYLFFPPDERLPEERRLQKVMTGKPISLASAFRLTYNMILNVLRVDELRVEEMMKQSFSEAGDDVKIENIAAVLEKARNTLGGLSVSGDEVVPLPISPLPGEQKSDHEVLNTYARSFCELSEASAQLTFRELNPVFEKAVVPGRLLVAEVEPGFLSLAVVYSIVRQNAEPPKVKCDSKLWVVALAGVVDSQVTRHPSSVLLLREDRSKDKKSRRHQFHPQVHTSDGLLATLREIHASKIVYVCDECNTQLTALQLDDQETAARRWFFTMKRLRQDQRDSTKADWSNLRKSLHANAQYLHEVMLRWASNIGKTDASPADSFPKEYMVSRNDRGARGAGKRNRKKSIHPLYDLRRKLCLNLITDAELGKAFSQVARRGSVSRIEKLVIEQKILKKMSALKTVSGTGSQPNLLPEYEKRAQVLQKLDYIDSDGLGVKMKGRCACEVSTADSVVLTEIILENVLDGLEPAEICSLLSSLVCRKKNANGVHDHDAKVYTEAYLTAKAKMRSVVKHVGNIQKEHGLELDIEIADGGDDYETAVCRWDLAHAVYAWANGEPFFSITELTEQQEGDIVVCVKRLSELLRDAQHVAKGIGNDDLLNVLQEAIDCIRRDVIFNGSLYYDGVSKESFHLSQE